ncbi:MAG: hypothetical protein ACOCP8_04280 [archaeon]
MSYKKMRKQLLKHFEENNFKEEYKNNNINENQYYVPNKYNLDLVINFPGYKTKRKKGYWYYDYRVDLNNTPISHVNIIIDLYNKAIQLDDITILYDFLIDIAHQGDDFNRKNYLKLDNINFSPPSQELLGIANKVYNDKNKHFDYSGNENWNYSIDELSHLIMWIVLQEDINYPMDKNFSGRRMSFYRYLEAIYTSKSNNKKINKVIKRAIKHGKPNLWKNENINYQPIIELGN